MSDDNTSKESINIENTDDSSKQPSVSLHPGTTGTLNYASASDGNGPSGGSNDYTSPSNDTLAAGDSGDAGDAGDAGGSDERIDISWGK